MNFKHKSYTLEQALVVLQKYCAYQERCHMEVEQKLKSMRMIPEAIDHIIVALISDNYLNEERFAVAYVRGKFNIKKWGKKRLLLELKQRKISQYNIEKALQQLDRKTYLSTFHLLAEKKANTLEHLPPLKKKKKLVDYLLYRGWESELIYDKINTLLN
jgi:regulatory protein